MKRKPFTSVALLVLGLLVAVPAASEAQSGNAHTSGAQQAPGQQLPSNVTPPSISGTPIEGQTLTASLGSWDGNGTTYGYQWKRCDSSGNACTSVGGAAGSTYALESSDVGYSLAVLVTATNHNGSVQATSDPTATVAPPPAPAPTTTAATTTTTVATPTPTTTTTATTTAATTTTATTTATSTSTNTSTTTATTTTTPLAPSYEFVGNFDTGDLSQWDWGAQCANTGTPSDSTFTRGSIYVNGTNRLQGGYSTEIDMPASTHLRACEVLHQRTLSLGTDQWYADAISFPTNWTEPSSASWGAATGQFNYELIWGAPVEIMVHGSYANLVLQSGYCQDATSPTPGCPYTTESGGAAGTISANDRIIPTGTQLAGHWVELIIHAHWASDFTGVVEGWWRYPGGTWQKTVSISGYPTVQWSTARPLSSFCTNLGQSNCHVTTDKTGFYSGPSGTAFTVRNDGFVEASSFADAAAELP